MEKDTFSEQVRALREQGLSIRSIASEVGAHPSRVQRAIATMHRTPTDAKFREGGAGARESVFVGRESEMAILRQALHDAESGSGRLVLITGDPGIGKSRLAWEFSSYASLHAVPVYWATCHEEPPTPPFWPWIQIARAYIHRHRAARLRSEMDLGAADIASIVPEVCQKLPDVRPKPPLNDPAEERFRLFDSMSRFLHRSSRRQPLVLILDNLQWCDCTSLLLLEFLAQELWSARLLVVGIYRGVGLARDHPLFSTLGVVSRQPCFPQIALRGLSQNEAAQLIRTTADIEPTSGLVEKIYGRTEGNPLFIIHIVRSLAGDGSLSRQAGEHGLETEETMPDSLRMTIGRTLAHLSPRCQRVMTDACVMGRQFAVAQLQQVVNNVPAYELYDLLDESVRAGVIRESQSELGSYEFTHVLVQYAMLTGLSAAQRAKMHARIGQVLEEMYGKDAYLHGAELAYHYNLSSEVTGPAKAVRYCRLAAERALAMFAYEEAALHFQKALQMKQTQTPAALHRIPDDETAEILEGLARAEAAILSTGADPQKPAETIGRLLDYYIGKGDIAHTMELSKFPMFIGDKASIIESRSRFERAFDLVDPGSREAGWLLCFYGYFLGTFGADYHGAQAAFERAMVIARRYGDMPMELRALINVVQIKAMYWQTDWDGVLRAIDMAQRLGDLEVEVAGRFFALTFATTTRTHGEAKDLWKRAMSIARQLRHRYWLDTLDLMAQPLAQYYGDFQASRAGIEPAAARGAKRNLLSLIMRGETEYELGETGEGDRFVQQAVEELDRAQPGPFVEYGWAAAQLPYVNYLTARQEWSDIEDRVIEVVLRTAPKDNFFATMARIGVGLRDIRHEDMAGARRSYDFLKGPLKAHPSRSMITPTGMSSDRLLGLLCLTFGDFDQAITHFEEAIKICQIRGYLPQMAWSCYDCARAMLKRRRQGDRKKAAALAAEAVSVADKLGMKLLASRIGSLQESRKAIRVTSDSPYQFTGREVEVLRLLARGKTNREIAVELDISLNTATTHVRNILNKGDLANRAEAAAFATRHYPSAE